MKYKGIFNAIFRKLKTGIMMTLIALLMTFMLLIVEVYAATGIANAKNEDTLVRLAAAKAMAQNSDRSVTLSQVKTVMETYVASSTIAVTEDTYKILVEYNDTGNQYEIAKNKTYTVTYNANGGSGGPGSQTKIHGTNLTLSSTKPTKTGYNFLGWSTSSTATSATYSAGGTYTSDASATLYAVWELAEVVYLSSSSLGGGVTAVDCKGNLNGNSGYVYVSYTNNQIVFDLPSANSNSSYAYFGLTPAVDLTNINTLRYTILVTDINYSSYGGECKVGVCSALPTYNSITYAASKVVSSDGSETAGATLTIDVDVSGLSGSYYICGNAIQHNNGVNDWKITSIKGLQ